MKLHKDPTLADSICDLRTRKIKKTFFTQINTLIDWKEISKLIDKDDPRGKSAVGNPSYGFWLLACGRFVSLSVLTVARWQNVSRAKAYRSLIATIV